MNCMQLQLLWQFLLQQPAFFEVRNVVHDEEILLKYAHDLFFSSFKRLFFERTDALDDEILLDTKQFVCPDSAFFDELSGTKAFYTVREWADHGVA